jgi:hypothetical protein
MPRAKKAPAKKAAPKKCKKKELYSPVFPGKWEDCVREPAKKFEKSSFRWWRTRELFLQMACPKKQYDKKKKKCKVRMELHLKRKPIDATAKEALRESYEAFFGSRA